MNCMISYLFGQYQHATLNYTTLHFNSTYISSFILHCTPVYVQLHFFIFHKCNSSATVYFASLQKLNSFMVTSLFRGKQYFASQRKCGLKMFKSIFTDLVTTSFCVFAVSNIPYSIHQCPLVSFLANNIQLLINFEILLYFKN